MATAYFVAALGSDANSGTSVDSPWASIDKVNETQFGPGDVIHFRAGDTFHGQLRPRGEGAPGSPIVIRAYGEGSKPVIDMGASQGVGIHLVNQSWWEIEGIEVTSGVPFELNVWRRGIVAEPEGVERKMQHIVIRNCDVHDIWGNVGGDLSGMGIYVGQSVLGDTGSTDCITDDVVVENNRIWLVDKVGIAVCARHGVVIRGNQLLNIGGDGIVAIGTDRGLVEHNRADRTCLRSGDPDLDTGGEEWWPHTAAIWLWRCRDTVMQFNAVRDTGRQRGNNDGQAYDFDFGCIRCVLQFNYSESNHGMLLVMDQTRGNIARYNISQNDQRDLLLIHGNVEDGNVIHNNVFYLDHSTVNVDFHRQGDIDASAPEDEAQASESGTPGALIKDNIFYATGQGRFRAGGSVFSHNCYFGPWVGAMPVDPNGVNADPMFVAAGVGTGLDSLEGYRLRADSPCIRAGEVLESDNARDFEGNPLHGDTVDIGAFERRR